MSDKTEKLTVNQRKAISALLTNTTVEKAADEVGVNPRTIYRWLDDPDFRIALYQEQTVSIDQALMPLVGLVRAAVVAFAEVLRNPHSRGANVRRLAAQNIIEDALKMRDRMLEQRVTELERVVYKDGEK